MTALRSISLPVHGVLELLFGLALLAAPFLLGFAPAGTILAVGIGVLLVGLALGAGDSLPVSAHHSFDQALVLTLAVAALALAYADDRTAAPAVLMTAAALQLALTLSTRYSRFPAR